MRRDSHWAKFVMGTLKVSIALTPILLNSCGIVQPGANDPPPVEAEIGDEQTIAKAPLATADESLEVATATEALAGVESTAAPVAPTPLSPSTRRTAAGLPPAVAGYLSWNSLQAADGLPALSTVEQYLLYIRLPPEVETGIGEKLALPFALQTAIVIESKRAIDDSVRQIDTLVRAESGWEFSTFLRRRATEPFGEKAGTDGGGKASEAGKALAAAIDGGETAWVLGE